MAIKKSTLYSSLWQSCDELRGGMDASQYKDYVLVLLFIKYISDKWAGQPFAPITVPAGASFADMVRMKGHAQIGDRINKEIIGPIAKENPSLGTISVDFDDSEKLGNGPEKVKRLTNLIAIFENPALDFSANGADGDDILGDAYEFLMRHFATQSGKSKGQFYTPAEVSRIMAQIIGISPETATADTTIYDPTCGSGSLLLKVAAAAGRDIAIYGQEKDVSTAALARMNMVLHNSPTAQIACNGNSTLSDPLFLDNGGLKTFSYVVANPPFSYKAWSTGVSVDKDPYERFDGYGIPPAKNGDYAFLLHILRSLKPNEGVGAVILPHGVLFRGNGEAKIRENLLKRGLIRGIIGLPANLFYGTGIPACILILDKSRTAVGADAEELPVMMIDASKGFEKDGPKNRLREQDIHKIVDVYRRQELLAGYSRLVPLAEIRAKGYNLNLPRYIAGGVAEDRQDISAHILGGIPAADIDALAPYWAVFPDVRAELFEQWSDARRAYLRLRLPVEEVKAIIFGHPQFRTWSTAMENLFAEWKGEAMPTLENIGLDTRPRVLIHTLSEALLARFRTAPLLDAYDLYQHIMAYWAAAMADDVYDLAADGWAAGRELKLHYDKKGTKVTGFEGRLIPRTLIEARFFRAEAEQVAALEAASEAATAALEEFVEEDGEEGWLADLDKLNKGAVSKRLKALRAEGPMRVSPAGELEDPADDADAVAAEEAQTLGRYLELESAAAKAKDEARKAELELNALVREHYSLLTEAEIKTLLIEDKWMADLHAALHADMDRLSARLTRRISELVRRYASTLMDVMQGVGEAEEKVLLHLQSMGF